MTEAQQALNILQVESSKVEAFERLLANPDFQLYFKEVDIRIEHLRNLLEDAKDEDLANIRGQLKAARGLKELIHQSVARRAILAERIKELEDAEGR